MNKSLYGNYLYAKEETVKVDFVIFYRLLPSGVEHSKLSKLDILSESMMDKSALNDLETHEGE